MKHNLCGFEYKVTPDDFLNGGTRCPKCFGNRRKTTNQFKSEVYEMFGDEYIVLGEYINTKTPLMMSHNSEKCCHKFMVSPSAFLRGSYCNKCGTEKRSGKNHYKYNPNLTEEDRLARDMQNGEIKKWRDKIYKRDDYTCQICYSKGYKLNAHHINSWDAYIKERFDIENGITLCESCHKEYHSAYGYGNNDKSQFTKYLNSFKNKQLAFL